MMNVSIVIPCHNAEPYLAQTVGSALDQTRPPHEIIIVDDGSTDGSLAVAQAFAARCGQVHVLSRRSGSAARTRNLGASLASGEALMFLDADDVLGPDALEALMDALAGQPQSIAVCPWYRLEYIDGRWVKQPPSCRPRRPGEDALSAWLRGWYHPPCTVLWSRGAYAATGGWDGLFTPNDDGDIMMRALAAGIPLVQTAAGCGFYRRLPQGRTSLSGARFTAAGLASRIRVIEKICRWLEERGRVGEYRDAIREAFQLIAADAGQSHPDLRAQAEACAGRYAPPAWIRAGRRALRALRRRRRVMPANPPGATADEEFEEINCGLERAGQVLAAPPTGDRAVDGSDERGPLPDPPAVSVIIPTYNRAHLLPRTLGSVLGQTFGHFEVLVVDDGSTDETAAVMVRCTDRRVRYLRQPHNAGVSAARNRGLREARGEFIAFLDSDDEWLAGKLAAQMDLFRSLPADVGLVYSGVETVHEDGSRTVECSRHRGDVYRRMLLSNVIHGGGSNALIRRDALATAGFFDETLPAIEDYDYWLRIARFFRVDYVEAPLIRYHSPPGVERKSQAIGANLEARWRFYRKHAAEMRRAGVAHLFLLESVRRAITAPRPDMRIARRLAAQAVLEAPTSRQALRMLKRVMLRPVQRTPRRQIAVETLAQRRPAISRPSGMRILLYCSADPAETGGLQAVFNRLGSHLRRKGHAVVKAWPLPVPDRLAGDATYTLPLLKRRHGLPTPRSLFRAGCALLRLASSLARHRPQVVNYHYVTSECLYFLLLRPLLRYRVVLSVHGSDLLRPTPWDAVLVPRLLPMADAVTTVSQLTAERVRRLPGVEDERVRVIPNGIDTSFWNGPPFDGAITPRRRATPFPRRATPSESMVLAVGRLHPVKGQDLLLRAFAMVIAQIPQARLVIAGDGVSRAELQHLSEGLELGEAVEFAGDLDAEAVRARMREAAVFVLPSRSEGLPLALMEAMAAGVPAVATRVGGVPEVLVPGTGLLVPPEDPEGLGEAICALLQDRALASALSRRAQERAGHFSAAAAYAAYEAQFLQLVLSSKSRASAARARSYISRAVR